MTRTHHHSFRLHHWMFVLGMLLGLSLAQPLLAQDAATKEATPIVTDSPGEITLEPGSVPSAGIEATLTPVPTEQLETPSLTISPEQTEETTFAPTAEVTLPAVTPLPTELTTSPTLSVPTETDLEVTTTTEISPSAEPHIVPTVSITPVRITMRPDARPESSVISFLFFGENLADVSTLAIACHVDPTMLRGIQALPGTWFAPGWISVTDSGFQPDGQWMLTAVQTSAAAEISASGELWRFDYQVVAAGMTTITCIAYVLDANGLPLPMTSELMTLMVENYREATAQPLTLETPPAITPVSEIIPITNSPESTPEMTSIPTVRLEGDADGNGRVDEADVALVMENFGWAVPLAAAEADLNGDQVVNIYDLALVSAHTN